MRTVIVTGASRGIGRAIARQFAAEGDFVIGTYHTSTDPAQLEQLNLRMLPCNVAEEADMQRVAAYALEQTGQIDVLVHNAGVAFSGLMSDMTARQFDAVSDVNFKGAFFAANSVTPAMVRQKSGVIINISSVWGVTGASCEAVYAATKAAVIGLTKSLAKELGPSGIRVNAIAPGVIKTDMLDCYTQEDLAALRDETPLQRLGSPEDVAALAGFLAGDAASFITGQVIGVDGGFGV